MRPFRRGRGTMAGSGNLITLLFTALCYSQHSVIHSTLLFTALCDSLHSVILTAWGFWPCGHRRVKSGCEERTLRLQSLALFRSLLLLRLSIITMAVSKNWPKLVRILGAKFVTYLLEGV